MLRKIKKPISKDTLDGEIKRLDVASQTPGERKHRRQRRFNMLRNKPVT